jgi:hypothetical protein
VVEWTVNSGTGELDGMERRKETRADIAAIELPFEKIPKTPSKLSQDLAALEASDTSAGCLAFR